MKKYVWTDFNERLYATTQTIIVVLCLIAFAHLTVWLYDINWEFRTDLYYKLPVLIIIFWLFIVELCGWLMGKVEGLFDVWFFKLFDKKMKMRKECDHRWSTKCLKCNRNK